MQKDPQAQAQAAMAAQQEAMIKAQQEQAKVSTENSQAQATSKIIDDVRRREIEDKQAVTPEKGRGKNAT